MHERGHQIMAIVTAAGILLAGGAMFAFPPYKERHAIGAEIADLETRIQDLDGLTEEVQVLAEEYTDLRGGLEQDLKAIPGRPGVSEIMRKLSLPVDGMTVLDQTFTAGGAGDAVIGAEHAEQAVRVSVEMDATFEAVFALIHAAEKLDRLVRVGTVRLSAARDQDDSLPMLTASVGLDVIYKPSSSKED